VALATLFLSPCATQAQTLMPDSQAVQQMRLDVYTLADDSMQGRETGTVGEQMASRYIVDRYKAIGLAPKGDSTSYLNAFHFAALPRTGPGNTLKIGRHTLKFGDDFYPLGYSANANVLTRVARCKYGILAPELDRNDFDGVEVKDHAAAMSISSPDGIHPHSKWIAHNDLRSRIDDAIKLGANAILFYNDDPETCPWSSSPRAASRSWVSAATPWRSARTSSASRRRATTWWAISATESRTRW